MNSEDEAQTHPEAKRHGGALSVLKTREMNRTTETPLPSGGDTAFTYVLLPFFIITFAGIVVAAVMYIRRKQRIDRLRHQLLPVYSYDPSEEVNEAEREMMWREDDSKGWTSTYQQWWPLLPKDPNV